MRTVAIFLAILSCAGCEDFGIEVPPAVPIAQLLQVPDTISVDGKQLYLTTALGRDFFPISPPDGRPLVAVITLTTADSSQLERVLWEIRSPGRRAAARRYVRFSARNLSIN